MRHYATAAATSACLVLLSAVPAAAQNKQDEAALCHHSAPAIRLQLGELRRRAHAGDGTATCLIGLKYLTGHGVERDEAKAANWLRQGFQDRSSTHPSVAASMYYLAQMRIKGSGGIERDPAGATALLREAAQRGHLQAHVYLGLLLERGEGIAADPEAAVMWYRRAAARDYAPAMFYLASAYERGVGVTADPTQATHWYQKAAALGLAEGQYNAGLRLLLGLGATASPKRALTWLQQAAQQGLQEAQALLAKIHSTPPAGLTEDSPGTPPQPADGERNQAPASGTDPAAGTSQPAASGNRQRAERQASPRRPRRGVRAITAQPPQSTRQRHAELLRQAVELLRGDKRNRAAADTAAFQILSELAAKGHPTAQFQLGSLYQLGRGTAADASLAGQWHQRAARAGHPEAQHRLALLYATGVGHPQNFLEAYIWLSLAVATTNHDEWRQQRDAVFAQLSAPSREQAQVEAQHRWNKIQARGMGSKAP